MKSGSEWAAPKHLDQFFISVDFCRDEAEAVYTVRATGFAKKSTEPLWITNYRDTDLRNLASILGALGSVVSYYKPTTQDLFDRAMSNSVATHDQTEFIFPD